MINFKSYLADQTYMANQEMAIFKLLVSCISKQHNYSQLKVNNKFNSRFLNYKKLRNSLTMKKINMDLMKRKNKQLVYKQQVKEEQQDNQQINLYN